MDDLSRSTIPKLLVTGMRDELLDPAWAHEISRHVPNCRIAELDTKHAPNIDQPDALRDMTSTFFAELE